MLEDGLAKKRPSTDAILASIPAAPEAAEATRQSGSNIINQIAAALPTYVSGSADLHGSNKNYIKGAGDFGSGFGKTYAGKNFYYGIREHAMAASPTASPTVASSRPRRPPSLSLLTTCA